MRLTPRTIFGQLIAGTVIVQLLVFTVFLAVSVRHEFHHTQERDADRMRKQTGIIASLVAEPLAKDDPDLMDHVMHAVPIAASIKAVRLTDTHGAMLRNSSNDLPMVLSAQELALLPELAKEPRYRTVTLSNGDLEGIQPVLADGLVRGIVWITQDTSITLATPNSVLESLLIYSPFALVGNLLLVWVLSGSLARPLRRLRQASQQVQLDPDDLSAFPLPAQENNEAGELTASVNAMVNEIATQRRGTQDTLSLLDSMLTSAPIGFGFYDRDYRYVRINERLAHMHGVSIEDHIGRHLRDLVPASAAAVPEQVEAIILRVFTTGLPVPDTEISCDLLSDDAERTFRTSYFPVFAGGEVRWVGVIATDITEHRRAEAEVRSTEKLAASSRLAASIANEISNPLDSVTNLLHLLRQNASLSQEADDYLALAQSEIARVGEITQQTLSFYRQPRAATEVRVADMLRSVLSRHQSRLESSGVTARLRLDKDAVLYGHPGELRQLFANLVSHSIDSMPRGGQLYLRVRHGQRCNVSGVRITIAQTGSPIPDSMCRQILETISVSAHEADRTGTLSGDEVLTKHRGRVQVRSQVARFQGDTSGTVFRLFFPVRGVPRGPFIVHSSQERALAHQSV